MDIIQQLVDEDKKHTQPNLLDADQLKLYLSNASVIDEDTKKNVSLKIEDSGLSAIDKHVLFTILIEELIVRGIIVVENEGDKIEKLKKMQEEAKELLKYRKTWKKVSEFGVNFPGEVDLLIPPGYTLSKENGIEKVETKDGQRYPITVCPYIVLPCQFVNDPKNTSGDKLVRLTKWNNKEGKWEYHPYPVSIGKITKMKEIGVLDDAGIIVLGDKYRKALADFNTDLINANNKLVGLQVNEAISNCGWTSEGLFFPFTTKEKGENLIFTGIQGTTTYSIYEAVKKMPKGEISKANEILQELQDNPVFGICLAGVLASPLVPKLEGILDENIGIEVSGRSSKGKTTIQTLAATLVYGLGEELKASWAKAKEAGIWRKAESINNLPYILDDSHRITEKLQAVPHDLINGKEGDKSTLAKERWDSKDNTKWQYRGVILFNGEVSISVKSPSDTVGIYGRTIMIDFDPFPSQYNGTMVESLKRKAMKNGGHFAEPWIRHLSSIDEEQTVQSIIEIKEGFGLSDADEKLQRLTTKASVLVWALQEFNQLFGVNVNIGKVKELLGEAMQKGTQNVGVADKIMKKIIDDVWAEINNEKTNENGYINYNYASKMADLNGSADMFYKVKEHLVMKNAVLEQILKGSNFGSIHYVRSQLASVNYLETYEKGDMKEHSYISSVGKKKMYGLKFPYEMFKHLLPSNDEEVTEENEQEASQTKQSVELDLRLPPIHLN